MKRFIALVALAPLVASAVSAADLSNTNSPDKSQYNLFHPTPRDLMRPLNSDQFDSVLDAHTLDAGHVQLEASLVNYYYYSAQRNFSGLSYRLGEDEYFWGPRLRVGLWNNVDFEVNPTYSIRSENVNGAYSAPFVPFAFNTTTHSSGFEALGLGPKINLWGNDDGPTALAIHPYLSVPTSSGELLGGVDIPFGWRLPHGLYLKLDSEFYVTDNSRHTHYEGFFNSASIHKSLGSKTEAYWYLESTVTSGSLSSWYGYTGFGLAYTVTHDLQLFGGIGFGLDSLAYDYNPRFGVVFRY
jgi:opacity protein-like surface antigen